MLSTILLDITNGGDAVILTTFQHFLIYYCYKIRGLRGSQNKPI